MIRPRRQHQSLLKALGWPLPLALLCAVGLGGCKRISAFRAQPQWYKGNLHTHTLWSDGGDYPEMVTEWYKTHGYQFLGLSDHNVMLTGERWIPAIKNKGGEAALKRYRARFGNKVEGRTSNGESQVRLKNLDELKAQFEQPGRFLMIPSEEITDGFERKPVHMGAVNLQEVIPPQGGRSVVEVVQNNINAVQAQRERTGVPMIPHLNHPNFGWGITAEELAQVDGEPFFEVYNGHPGVWNRGDHAHAGTERMWDLVLTKRLTELHKPIMFGIATDDAHDYLDFNPGLANPGQGWLMVRAKGLDAASLIAAMEAGDFYASSGVTLRELQVNKQVYSLAVQPEPGVDYTIQFIGTRGGETGAVLAEQKGTQARYIAKGDELYIRAKVTSSKRKPHPTVEAEPFECAWTQPVQPRSS